ncbi:homocysteine S-methyltransferase family protein [Oscillatoria sp. CS-180]|uniref:homocysteine S-methyltransferase family protein n=1 Tax=Oscillatoria sp. CS-180 TaxID=3021720 RepID=UPI00233144D5|nr:homocysteine S-methyltransferase family protein [Oscillatoria sp. CS-180]MDB9528677.1 homocysteine S-methyltransferase family protein [Oscillatoria sp. CS-180]
MRSISMSRYRNALPQLSNHLFLTDGGLETTLIFHEGLNLPEFAAFDLLKDAFGYQALLKYFRTYAQLAQSYKVGCVLESATWRASLDWGEKLGYSRQAIAELNHKAIDLLYEVRAEYETASTPVVISGCIGPKGDGYSPDIRLDTTAAENYHTFQSAIFKEAGADLITAVTMNYVEEAIGIARAAKLQEMPVVISFTVETDGCLPTGQSLKEAIAQVDAATQNYPSYYMINCAHPFHFAHVLLSRELWLNRIGGIRPNASIQSHAELDEAEELDEGNPQALGAQCVALKNKLPNLRVLGGCCGTDHRHVAEIFEAFQKASNVLDLAEKVFG